MTTMRSNRVDLKTLSNASSQSYKGLSEKSRYKRVKLVILTNLRQNYLKVIYILIITLILTILFSGIVLYQSLKIKQGSETSPSNFEDARNKEEHVNVTVNEKNDLINKETTIQITSGHFEEVTVENEFKVTEELKFNDSEKYYWNTSDYKQDQHFKWQIIGTSR